MHDDSIVHALRLFEKDWACTTCPNCGTEKWKNSPFCRRCSIRLQRRNLFMGYQSWTGHSLGATFRFFKTEHGISAAVHFAEWYDRCRDYLAVTNGRQD